jgi:cobalt-zinc-cadmium efflux system outer membrane protein
MKRRNSLKLWLALSLLNSTTLFAAEAPKTNSSPRTNAVALEKLVSEILEHNPELTFYKAEIAAARGERRTASALPNPELSSQLGYKNVRERDSGLAREGVAWSVSVQQSFEWPGRIALRKAIANQQIAMAELGLAQFRATLAARARTLAFNVFAAQQKAMAAREVADRFQELREVLVQRDPAGLTPELEMRIIEATEIRLHHDMSEAVIESESALLELNQLRGRPWQQTIQVSATNLSFSPAPPTDVLIDAAFTNNFELRTRRVELEQQGFKIALARNERYPAVSVGPYFSQENAGDRESIIGLGVTVPLPLWNRNKGNIDTAKAREKQAEVLLQIAQRDLERKVLEQVTRYRSKRNEMEKWRPDSIEQFRNAAALADRHYRLGAVPISTYVELQKQYLEAVNALLDTRREMLDSRQQLESLTGISFPNATP